MIINKVSSHGNNISFTEHLGTKYDTIDTRIKKH